MAVLGFLGWVEEEEEAELEEQPKR